MKRRRLPQADHPSVPPRRTKELVASDFRRSWSPVVYCDMEEAQRSRIQHWREYYRQAIFPEHRDGGNTEEHGQGPRRPYQAAAGLLPSLSCDERYRGSSGKFEAFSEMLEDIIAEGHRALVFSQFVRYAEASCAAIWTGRVSSTNTLTEGPSTGRSTSTGSRPTKVSGRS